MKIENGKIVENGASPQTWTSSIKQANSPKMTGAGSLMHLLAASPIPGSWKQSEVDFACFLCLHVNY